MTAPTPAKHAAHKKTAVQGNTTTSTPHDGDTSPQGGPAMTSVIPPYIDPLGRHWQDQNADGRGVNEHITHEADTLRDAGGSSVEVSAYRRYYSDGEVEQVVNIEANSAELSTRQVDELIASLVSARNSIQVRED